MAISVVDVTTAWGNPYIGNPKYIDVSRPSGLAVDDLLVAVIGGFDVTFSSSGFTTRITLNYTDHINRRISVLSKRVVTPGSEPSTYRFNTGSYPINRVVLMALRGAYHDDLGWQFVSVGNDYNVTRTITGVTTLNDNAYVFSVPNWVQYHSGLGDTADGLEYWTSDTGAVTDVYVGEGGEYVTTHLLPYDSGSNYYFGHAIGYNVKATAGLNISTVWTRYGGSEGGAYGGNSMGIQFVINSQGPGGGGTCTCNAICDNDCGSNQICTGHSGVCSNNFTFTSIAAGTIILAQHVRELETAINLERADTNRRFNATAPAYCSADTGVTACQTNAFSQTTFTGGGAGDVVQADDFEDVKESNNEIVYQSTFGSLNLTSFIDQISDPINSVIEAADIVGLQNSINATRNACICDSHCNCDPSDCGCNGECPSDDYYYYV